MQQPFDVLVIGAGFSGLYSLHKLRDELGLRVAVLEKGADLGGVWFYNRYPGARCDIESIEYSYSFSDEIQQEWVWSEVLPAQPEIEAYLHFVADRLDLRKSIRFDANVRAMTFDESASEWLVETDAGDSYRAPFVVAATGILSVPLEPQIAGMDSFEGVSLSTSRFPHDGFDFSGNRVGLVGTGSTGIQVAPVLAEQAVQLFVFQRSAAYTLPSNARAYAPGELDELKARYAEIRAAQKESYIGAARLSAFSVLIEMASKPPILTLSLIHI